MSRPTVELSMIVKNGGSSIDRCLAHAAPLVDRIVIGDTGSTDDSIAIARRYGAETFTVNWQNDFAAARNQVLAHGKCDWIVVLDADEMIDAAGAASKLRDLLLDDEVHAYTLERLDYVDDLHADRGLYRAEPNNVNVPAGRGFPGFVRSFHTRLFRRHPGIFFEGCVHERIDDRVASGGFVCRKGTIRLHHFGHVESPEAARREKIKLYQRLGVEKISREPRNFDAHFQLGVTELVNFNKPAKALLHFRTAASIRPLDSRAPLYAGICCQRLGRIEDARRFLLRSYARGERSELLFEALGARKPHEQRTLLPVESAAV